MPRAFLIQKIRQGAGFAFFHAQSKARRKKVGAHKKSGGSAPVKSVGGFMKRQELKALLHGVENAGEIIDQIMEINGADIENAKKEKSA